MNDSGGTSTNQKTLYALCLRAFTLERYKLNLKLKARACAASIATKRDERRRSTSETHVRPSPLTPEDNPGDSPFDNFLKSQKDDDQKQTVDLQAGDYGKSSIQLYNRQSTPDSVLGPSSISGRKVL